MNGSKDTGGNRSLVVLLSLNYELTAHSLSRKRNSVIVNIKFLINFYFEAFK